MGSTPTGGTNGAIAQLGERNAGSVEVVGSNPTSSIQIAPYLPIRCMSAQNKEDMLGMPYGTACHQLRQMILFSLAQRLGLTTCFVCERDIESVSDLSIEHKVPWSSDVDLFWDLNNIAFSHRPCNTPHVYGRRKSSRKRADGKWLCTSCDRYLEQDLFSFYTPSKTRLEKRPRSHCKECRAQRRKMGLTT